MVCVFDMPSNLMGHLWGQLLPKAVLRRKRLRRLCTLYDPDIIEITVGSAVRFPKVNRHYRLEILEPNHREALGELRRIAYKTLFGDRVEQDKLAWNANDLLFLNLGLFVGDQLTASLRISVIESDEEFRRVTLQPPPPTVHYPLVILSRGATLPELSSQGLHSHLRLNAMKLIQAAGPWDILGTMEADSPRLKQLQELGYTFETCPNQWDGFLKNSQPIVLATLDRSRLQEAISKLEARLRKKTHENDGATVDIAFDIERAAHRLQTHSHRVSHERLDFDLDNKAMWNEVRPLLERFPRYDRSPSVGGWSLQSHPGAPNPVHSGWPIEFLPYNGPGNRGPTWTPRTPIESQLFDVQSYEHPTELCTPMFQRLLERLTAAGLTPRRARIIRMPPNATMRWHQDGSPRIYQVRIHAPLFTNESCFFESEFGRVQMRTDGGIYFVHINRPHRAVNEGDTDRYHFVAHAWDTLGLTRHHRYDPSLYQFETHHADDVDLERQFNLPPPKANPK